MKKLIRIVLISVIALVLLGSLSTAVQADPDALNVDYVGWYLTDSENVNKVALSFDANLTGEYEIIVELMDNDKRVVSTGNLIVTNLDKKDKVIIDLIDASVAIIYYIEVTVKKLPAPGEDYGYWEEPTGKIYLSGKINSQGVMTQTVTAESFDKRCRLTIEKGTTALTRSNDPLSWISMYKMKNPPDPPEGANVISLFYDFKPDGAIFDPPATLEYHYELSEIPEGVDKESLVVAFWDALAGEWVKLECTVNTETQTITAKLEHFTVFAIFGYETVTPPVVPTVPSEPEPTETPEPTPPEPEPSEPTPSVSPEPSLPETETPVSPETSPLIEPVGETEEINWPLIVGVIAGLLVFSGIAYFIRRKRAH